MTDSELNDILDTWAAPAVPPSLRAGLRLKFPGKRVRGLKGMRFRWIAAMVVGVGAVVGSSLVTDGAVGADTYRWGDHLFLRRTKIVQPAIAKLNFWHLMKGRSTGFEMRAGRLVGSVYLYNRLTLAHSGYTMEAMPVGDGGFLITVLPLDPTVVKEAGSIVVLPPMPPVTVRAGSTFEVPVYQAAGVRVYERYEFAAEPLTLEPQIDATQLAAVMSLTEPRLYRNGQLALGPGGVANVKGLSVMAGVPGIGTFVLAVDPQMNSRFVPAGRVADNAIDFDYGGEHYRIESTAPIVAGPGRSVYLFFRSGVNEGFGSGGSASEYR